MQAVARRPRFRLGSRYLDDVDKIGEGNQTLVTAFDCP